MPLAEVPAMVAGRPQNLRDGDLFRPQRPAGGKGAIAIWMASSHEAAAGRGAARMPGVEAVESQSGGGDFIELGCAHMRMSIVAGLFPAVIVTHEEHDVRQLGCGEHRTQGAEDKA